VFAAGDAASPMANATIAAAAGVMAAGGAHHSLIYGLAKQGRASSDKAA
jgi:thioredoxin reductase (NADPH)